MQPGSRRFYERRIAEGGWQAPPEGRAEAAALRQFVDAFRLAEDRVLEVGIGRGAFQDVVRRWVGADLAASAGRLVRKPFSACSAEALAFRDESFDGVWSIAVLEHVPRPEQALQEIARVLRPGGLAYLAPAWHCRSWARDGLPVRPYSELSWSQRLSKATIPMRDSLLVRGALELPVRLWRELRWRLEGRALSLRFGRLDPNYETFWCADSDACSVLDPHEVLLWFASRGWTSPSHGTAWRRLFVRHGAVVLRKPGP